MEVLSPSFSIVQVQPIEKIKTKDQKIKFLNPERQKCI